MLVTDTYGLSHVSIKQQWDDSSKLVTNLPDDTKSDFGVGEDDEFKYKVFTVFAWRAMLRALQTCAGDMGEPPGEPAGESL